ncbi:hypothetical protein [Acidisphaera sp. L21]|uniref:hypothetical protein n=1 Tax=Acidisphaera sp. L21 TaxID=1641851 RepID=UPI00131CE607|nr:hypothetical protein [Acidisphaera sp. L21]
MPEKPGFSIAVLEPVEGKTGATAAFPYDRMTVERFRSAFPGARWRDDLRAWFVPGTTAERRLNRWLGREMAGVLAYADDRGRDAFAFQAIESRYLEVADDLLIRTPYSKTVVEELRAVPWAAWDGDLKAWRVPFRSWEDLQRCWPTIEAAAQRNEAAERKQRQQDRRGTPGQLETAARAAERQRRRYPVPDEPLPPLDQVVMTHLGAMMFTDVTGGLVDDDIAKSFYPDVSTAGATLIWVTWRKPTHEELVKAWPARWAADDRDRARGWWQPTIEESRVARRKAASTERARETRR